MPPTTFVDQSGATPGTPLSASSLNGLVVMDTTEAASNDSVSSANTFWANMNRLRYVLAQIQSGAWNAATAMIPLSQKAAANGVATLDSTGHLPAAQLPTVFNVSARYTRATAQTFNGGTDTIANFDTADFDTNSAVTTGSAWKFTAPIAGNYLVSASVVLGSVSWTGGNEITMKLWKNGLVHANLRYYQTPTTSSYSVGMRGADLVNLAASDYIYVTLNPNVTFSPSSLAGSQYSYISIAKVA